MESILCMDFFLFIYFCKYPIKAGLFKLQNPVLEHMTYDIGGGQGGWRGQ